MTETGKRPWCQVPGCRKQVGQVVEIDVPASWDAFETYTTLTVHLGTCRKHGRELTRRMTAMLEARVEYAQMVALIGGAAVAEASARGVVEELRRLLTEAEGAVAFQRERAERAEAALSGERAS